MFAVCVCVLSSLHWRIAFCPKPSPRNSGKIVETAQSRANNIIIIAHSIHCAIIKRIITVYVTLYGVCVLHDMPAAVCFNLYCENVDTEILLPMLHKHIVQFLYRELGLVRFGSVRQLAALL